MDNNQPKPQNQISLELKPEVAKGCYSNLAIISHSRSEFIIDFATTLPGIAKPEIGNRIIMTPEHAKRLMKLIWVAEKALRPAATLLTWPISARLEEAASLKRWI